MAVSDDNTQFSITLPNQAIEMMKALEPMGVYGRNRADIARTLILDALKKLIADGIVPRPSPKHQTDDN